MRSQIAGFPDALANLLSRPMLPAAAWIVSKILAPLDVCTVPVFVKSLEIV